MTDPVPIVLVGNKSDLQNSRTVPKVQAVKTSEEWGCVPYYETSARTRENVDEVFTNLCRQIIRKDQSKNWNNTGRGRGPGCCTIL